MATTDVTAGQIMELAAALLNDTERQIYTDTALLPYLKIALKDLREQFELSSIPVTQATSAILEVPAATTSITFSTTPALPTDLVSIDELWESDNDERGFSQMKRREFIPASLTTPVGMFQIYAWNSNTLKLPSSSMIRYLKMDYLAQLFNTTIDENSIIGIINGESYLQYRVAGLAAFYIGENKSRSDDLNGEATLAYDRATGIENQSKQGTGVRRRPFRSGYKSRNM
jgi:hypothetical protein